MWYIYTKEQDSILRNHILKLVGIWMELEKNLIISKIVQTQRTNIIYFYF